MYFLVMKVKRVVVKNVIMLSVCLKNVVLYQVPTIRWNWSALFMKDLKQFTKIKTTTRYILIYENVQNK